ncbi:tetraspanin-9-like isoform X2 [Anoplophora glabripennis]|uniref:tetraspanin-9-like isoform X2 n=1 Tax=Anoplophora glabripennis TaxID=217634 RepID=UPI0008751C2B|nr:tetraspanin-9-like isoform X2 [Anoplophora glabripennis]
MGCFRDFTAGIAKYILFLFNLLILICGIALIALGVIYKVNSSGIDFMSLSSLAIAIGAIISLIAFFGCCGAIKESSCMLTTYAAIVLTLFIIQVVLAILAFVAIRNEGTEVSSFIRDHLTSLYNNQNSLNLETLEVIHRGYECCGLDGPTGSEVQNNTQVMSSCCSKTVTTCTTTIAFQKGCVSAMTDFLNTNLKIIGIIAIVFAVVELCAALFAFYVRNSSQ